MREIACEEVEVEREALHIGHNLGHAHEVPDGVASPCDDILFGPQGHIGIGYGVAINNGSKGRQLTLDVVI